MAKPTAEEAREIYVQSVLDDGWKLRESYNDLLKARKANREELRNMAAQGRLSDEQTLDLEELYPERENTRRSAEERAAELEARAAEIREKAKGNGGEPAEEPAAQAA